MHYLVNKIYPIRMPGLAMAATCVAPAALLPFQAGRTGLHSTTFLDCISNTHTIAAEVLARNRKHVHGCAYLHRSVLGPCTGIERNIKWKKHKVFLVLLGTRSVAALWAPYGGWHLYIMHAGRQRPAPVAW